MDGVLNVENTKSVFHPGAGKFSSPQPLPWQNWERDLGILTLFLPIPSHPWYDTQRYFCPPESPQMGECFIPSASPHLGCFFPVGTIGWSL